MEFVDMLVGSGPKLSIPTEWPSSSLKFYFDYNQHDNQDSPNSLPIFPHFLRTTNSYRSCQSNECQNAQVRHLHQGGRKVIHGPRSRHHQIKLLYLSPFRPHQILRFIPNPMELSVVPFMRSRIRRCQTRTIILR